MSIKNNDTRGQFASTKRFTQLDQGPSCPKNIFLLQKRLKVTQELFTCYFSQDIIRIKSILFLVNKYQKKPLRSKVFLY